MREVPAGSRDVVIRLRPRAAARLVLQIRDLGGEPVPEVHVSASCMADHLEGTTGGDGVVAWGDVPIRAWAIDVRRSDEVLGVRQDVVPSGDPVRIDLHESCTIAVRAETPIPGNAILLVGRAGALGPYREVPWRPAEDGRTLLRVNASIGAVQVELVKWIAAWSVGESTAAGTATVAPGAEVVLRPLPSAAR